MTHFDTWLNEQTKPRHLMLVDDNVNDCEMFLAFSQPFNCRWSVATSLDRALAMAKDLTSISIIFLDLNLGSLALGVETFRRFKLQYPNFPIVVISGFLDGESISAINKIGFALFAQKPQCFTETYFKDMFQLLNIPFRP